MEDQNWTELGATPKRQAFWVEWVLQHETTLPAQAPVPAGRNAGDCLVVGLVRHAGHPFLADAPDGDPILGGDRHYQDIALSYLRSLEQALFGDLALARPSSDHAHLSDGARHTSRLLDPAVFDALASPTPAACVHWLHVAWGDPAVKAAQPNPYASFWITRRKARQAVPAKQRNGAAPDRGDADPDGDLLDCTLVLLAGPCFNGLSLGGDIGLRLALHVDPPSAPAPRKVRINGLTISNLDPAPKTHPVAGRFKSQLVESDHAKIAEQLRLDLNTTIAEQLGFSPNSLRYRTMVVPGDAEGLLRVEGHGVRQAVARPVWARRPRLYRFVVEVDATLQIRHLRTLALEEETSNALDAKASAKPAALLAPMRLFERDAASCGTADSLVGRRPSRSAEVLDLYRWPVGHKLKMGALENDMRFEVLGTRRQGQPTRTVNTDADTDRVTLQQDSAMPLRSDEIAAAQAYLRGYELFDRIAAYGLSVQAYFRHAELPLTLRPRSALRGAPDGDGVNAEARPYWREPSEQTVSTDIGQDRPRLLVRFGSADPTHRTRLDLREAGDDGYTSNAANTTHRYDGELPVTPEAPRQAAQYLGIAADPRWAWHEFGHVLNFASTGELEFAFAHSAGDALAAIATDPDSQLAGNTDSRGLTFPWVPVARRHDRSALLGYCWCGQRNMARLNSQSRTLARHHHGYFEEQLLSTSMFRLYLCLGGATPSVTGPVNEPAVLAHAAPEDPDTLVRRAASDYCIYLLMRAISLLGPDSVAPAHSVDGLVSALIDADLGTRAWVVDAAWPYRRHDRRQLHRRGGRAHKVIRWAFEQQGLYATDHPLAQVEGKGRPPAGDVYIADARRLDAPDGGYHPVPLRHLADNAAWPEGAKPWLDHPWLAHPDWVQREARQGKAGQLTFRVACRSADSAGRLGLRLWACDRATLPRRWKALGPPRELPELDNSTGLDSGGDLQRQYFELPAEWAGRAFWLLVNLHGLADPSNLPLADAPPLRWAELQALVAHDNNLALACLPASGRRPAG